MVVEIATIIHGLTLNRSPTFDPATDRLTIVRIFDDKPFNDVHYTKNGYRILGERLAEKAIEMLDPQSELTFPGEKSNFRGYVRYSGIKTEHGHFSVVCPKKAAPGRPWLWRSLFWEAIQQFRLCGARL